MMGVDGLFSDRDVCEQTSKRILFSSARITRKDRGSTWNIEIDRCMHLEIYIQFIPGSEDQKISPVLVTSRSRYFIIIIGSMSDEDPSSRFSQSSPCSLAKGGRWVGWWVGGE